MIKLSDTFLDFLAYGAWLENEDYGLDELLGNEKATLVMKLIEKRYPEIIVGSPSSHKISSEMMKKSFSTITDALIKEMKEWEKQNDNRTD